MIRPVSSARSAAFTALASALIAAVCFAGVAPSPAHASTVRWVAASPTVGSGTGCDQPDYVGATHASIQEAIDHSVAGDEVMICSGEYAVSSTITVNEDITLTGFGSTLPILDGGNTTRIMSIGTSASSSVTIDRLWFRNGRITGGGNYGAGIFQDPNSNLSVSNSHFSRNHADEHGGAIALIKQDGQPFGGSLTVTSSSFFRNKALDGGAIVVVGMVSQANVVRNSTFVSNSVTRQGGALGGSFSNFTTYNSTFLDNVSPSGEGGDTLWSVNAVGNLIAYSPGVNPAAPPCHFGDGATIVSNVSTHGDCLAGGESADTYGSLDIGVFGMWGGDTPVVSLGANSSAVDAVASANCPGSDQRGEARSGATCDAGAFENQGSSTSITATPSTITLFRGRPVTATFAASGFTPQSFRVANEVSEPLPSGVSMNATTGEISGTAGESYLSQSIVVTAVDASGTTASVRLEVDNCLANQNGSGSYVVSSADDLESFRIGACGSDADFLQARDLTWSGSWESQATIDAPFTGTYDGGGHSIAGLQATGTTASFVGYANGASIRNLSIDVDFEGSYSYLQYSPGGVVGIAFDTTIDDVHATGTIGSNPGTPDAWGCLGGLIGEGEGIVVTNSSFEGTVGDALSSWAGGLLGCPYPTSEVENSFFDGVVTGADDVGGLVGWADGTTIRRSFATGTVTAAGVDAGGLIGFDNGGAAVENSYFVGSIEGTGKVGGLVGDSENPSSITNSYASASLTGSSSVGGLVGESNNTTITSSFWEAGLAGADGVDPIGNVVGGQQPAVTATPGDSMKTFAFFDDAGWGIHDGWIAPADSQEVWGVCSGTTRPFLLWQHSTDVCAPPSDDSNDPGDGDSNSAPDNDSGTPTNNDSNTPPSNGSGTPTTNESLAAPSSDTPAAAASAGDTSSTTTSTTTAPVVEQATKSSASVDVGPKVATGKFAMMVGDKPVKSTVKWRSGSTIKGMVGVVNVAVVMNPGSVTYNMPGTLQPGSSFAVTLRGLKPGSDVVVNIHSTTRRLGRFTASSAGVIDAEVDIPMDMPAGSHRVEIQAVDKNNETVSMWMGVKVQGIGTLPSTGGSSSSPVMLALLLLCCGSLLVVVRRSRVVGIRSNHE